MPSGAFDARRNEYYRNRELYYNHASRSPPFHVIVGSESDGEHIGNKFCPFHGEQAKFDRLVRQAYFYPCCGMEVSDDEMGVDVQDLGVTTIDGRTSRSPYYGRSSESPGSIMIVPASSPRTPFAKKQPPPSAEDRKLAKMGYSIVSDQQITSTSKLLEPSQISSTSEIDSLRRNPIEERYRRKIHGLSK